MSPPQSYVVYKLWILFLQRFIDSLTMAAPTEGLISNSSALDNITYSPADYEITTINMTLEMHQQGLLTPSPLFMGVYFGLRSLWSIFSLIGNSLTIFMVVKFEKLQTSANMLVCSLGVADLLGVLLTPMLIFHQTHLNSPLYVPVCLMEKVMSTNLHLVKD